MARQVEVALQHIQKPLSMKNRPKALLSFIALLASATVMQAQDRTKDGEALSWNHELTVVPGTIPTGTTEYPAHIITVFETDANTALDLLKAEYVPLSVSIEGKPLMVRGAKLPGISDQPVNILLTSTTDKKANLARLSLAFMINDSTSLPDNGEQSRTARDLAVRLNKAVVQKQIDSYQKQLEKAGKKLGDTEEDVARSKDKLSKSNSGLQKAMSKRIRTEKESAALHDDISGLERTFALSNEPKDLKKLTKAREKLAKSEKAQAKLMQLEDKYQDSINKSQGSVDSDNKEADVRTKGKEDVQRIITELKLKLDNIR